MKIKNLLLASCLLGTVPNLLAVESLPYEHVFNWKSLENITQVDANNDDVIWVPGYVPQGSYDDAIKYSGSKTSAADDWAITPSFNFEAGYNYKLTFKTFGAEAPMVNVIEMKVGNGVTAEAMTKEIGTVTLTAQEFVTHEMTISVDATGEYNIGFHVVSEADNGTIYITKIAVSEGANPLTPAAVTDFTATAAVVDEAAVMNLSFTLPTLDQGGNPVNITDVAILRNGMELTRLGAKTAGEKVEYTDNAPVSGSQRYSVICYSEAGAGAEFEQYVSLIYATPKAPTNVVLENVDGKLNLTWDAVTEFTTTDNIMIPSKITYSVQDKSGVEIASGLTETSLSINAEKPAEGQALYSYTVTVNHLTSSNYTKSNDVLYGDAYTGEFKESFDDYKYTRQTWQMADLEGYDMDCWQVISSAYGTPSISEDADGTGGFARCSGGYSVASQRLISPIINISSMQNPRLTFYVYQTTEISTEVDRIIPEVLKDGVYTALNDGILIKGEADGWVRCDVFIPYELAATDIRLSFKGEMSDNRYNLAIDNIFITDALSDNVAVKSFVVPESAGIGEEVELVAVVENKGANVAENFEVSFYCDEELVETVVGELLESSKTSTFAVKYTPGAYQAEKELNFAVEVVANPDLETADNKMESVMTVKTSTLPVPDALTAQLAENVVVLNWTAPEIPDVVEQSVMTEDFETWADGTTEGINGWKFVDMDGFDSRDFGKMAFRATDKETLLSSYGWSNASTQSGNIMLFSQQCNSYYDLRNDWAISPEVVGGQTISFYVCEFENWSSPYYGTHFNFCYSTIGNNVEDFKVLESVNDKSSTWTKYEFVLPDDAKYFAIQVEDIDGSSWDSGLMIDDITYQPGEKKLVHTGYNIYRDKELLESVADATLLTYTDSNVEVDKTYTYAVSAIFESGESLLSNEVEIKAVSGVDSVVAHSELNILGEQQQIRIIGSTDSEVVVYNAMGQMIYAGRVETGNMVVPVSAGVYIVKAGEMTSKVIVK